MKVIKNNIKTFSNGQVMNLDPYCVNALKKDMDYLLSFDVDRLLAGFRETARLDMKGAVRYEGWENTLIGGHTIGHYLSAIAQAAVNPGVNENDRGAFSKIIKMLIDGLLECQNNSKGRTGFVFGAVIVDKENVELQFDNIEKNKTNINSEAWVPWYTFHKILAGVIDVYRLTGYAPSILLAKGMGDWVYERAMGWTEDVRKQVISIEYGGMNDVLYELYKYTEDEKYAIAAHCFDATLLFDKVNIGVENALNNHHANTTIPKFMGALNRYMTCHNKVIDGTKIDASVYLQYAVNFWDTVVNKHTYVTGGNSEWEHFGKDNILDRERTNCNCETCNIYNMLKLSRNLFCITGNVKYLDYYERAFYNTILSSQNPETGMTTYFQPMSTGYFKVFGQRFDKFWCCTGTGMENFTKLNDSIFFHDEDYLYISFYEKARLNWIEKNLKVSLDADLLKTPNISIKLVSKDDQPIKIGLKLRIPEWTGKEFGIEIDGIKSDYKEENGFVIIPSGLRSGVIIRLELTIKIRISSLPDNKRSVAFTYGPFVLSADLGTNNMKVTTTGVMVSIPAEKISTYDNIVLSDDSSVKNLLERPEKYMILDDSADELLFRLTINDLFFKPHFLRYKERYGIYFNVMSKAELKAIKEEKERALLDKTEGKIIDTVQPGYGQYENDELHNMVDWGGSVGATDGGTSRYAKPGGFFTYQMCVSKETDNYLSLTFLKADNGKSIRVSSGDDIFYEEVLEYNGDDETYEIRVKIPEYVVQQTTEIVFDGEKHSTIPITFRGSQGAQSARVFGFIHMMNL